MDGAGYYLSCMVLFNVLYGLSIIADGRTFIKHDNSLNFAGIATLIVTTILALLGICISVRILFTDDSERNANTTGKQFEVISISDLTGENYFANFSLLVLTGLSLSANPNWFDLIVFIVIEFSLGIVYIKKKMFYMNPILSLMNYSIFECTGKDPITNKDYSGKYYFVIKGQNVVDGDIIEYKNINSHVIRVNKKSK